MGIHIKTIQDECFQDYKKASMYIAFPHCTFKCLIEANLPIEVCQNCSLAKEKTIELDENTIVDRYLKNGVTSAVILAGLEPLDSFDEVLILVEAFRQKTLDDIVIYTGYYPEEIYQQLAELRKYSNIVVKFGRYVPNSKKRYDEVLGITLVSENQFAERIS